MEAQAFHVLMNYETPDNPEIVHPVTSLRFLMALNALGAEETSSQFKLATTLNYPATVLPHIQRSAPEGITIGHLYVGAPWLERMQNERELLLALGFDWCVLADGLDRIILSHLPKYRPGCPPPKKYPASQVRDAILSVPSVASLFQDLLVFNRWDVLGRLNQGVGHAQLAMSLEELDHISVQDPAQFLRVHSKGKTTLVEPPEILVHYPTSLLLDYVTGEIAQITPLQSAVPAAEPGHAIISVEQARLAPFLYGCVITCVGCGPIILTCGSPQKDSRWEQQMGLRSNASLQERHQHILQASDPLPPRLSGPNLLGLTHSLLGNELSPAKGPAEDPMCH
jgi:hypothetical protein